MYAFWSISDDTWFKNNLSKKTHITWLLLDLREYEEPLALKDFSEVLLRV